MLEALCMYKPADSSEAETIAERMAPRLMHANSAVTLAAVRVRLQAPHIWIRRIYRCVLTPAHYRQCVGGTAYSSSCT